MTSYSRMTSFQPLPSHSVVSWGALLAGLAMTTALGWLLMLLGGAFGLSIADIDDVDALSAGFGIAAILWFLASWLIAYFVGALMAARFSGTHDDRVGMLHGLSVWSLGTVTTVILASMGIQNALSAGQAIAGAGASATQAVASGVIGETASGGSSAISDLGDEVSGALRRSVSAELGEGSTSSTEIRDAMNDLDPETTQRVAMALITGDVEKAKTIVAARTSLSQAEINTIVTNAEEKMSARIETVMAEAKEAAETASAYGKAVLWTAFIAALVALLASVLGGQLGTSDEAAEVKVAVSEKTVV